MQSLLFALAQDDPGNGALILTAVILILLAFILVLAIQLIRRRSNRRH